MYLEQRRRRWYALHDIPADAQEVLGRKRFVISLETTDRTTAERRAAPHAARWRSEIERARTQRGDHVEQDAAYWRKTLEEAPEEHREMVRGMMADEMRDRVDRAAARAGITDVRDPAYEALPELAEAVRVVDIATGKLISLGEHLEEYLATLRNERKTVDMKRSTVEAFCKAFPYVADVQRKAVQRWLNGFVQDGKKPATAQRALSELRGYWAYLVSIEAAPEDSLPFEKLSMPKPPKNGAPEERKPLVPADVVKLLKAAKTKGDAHLADLIELGMWTGARIEELCALRIEKVSSDRIEIEDAKTAAGWRQVPIHSKLKRTLRRLVERSKDGFVLSGLTANKYGDRSNAIGKRFGHLKTARGFGPEHVFHSIRRTVATQLEDAGVPEGVAADIIGHDKPTMTYGLYSGGASLKTKREAIENLRYPNS